MSNLEILPSVLRAKFHDGFVSCGYDQDKVLAGTEDLTRLCDVDKSKSWSKSIHACKNLPVTSEQQRSDLVDAFTTLNITIL